GRASVLSPRTNVLICVLMDSHGRPVCDDGHPRTPSCDERHTWTHTDSHGRPVSTDVLCADGHTRTHTDSHEHPVCADAHTRTSCVC
ncbi:unnamed protein product, partial [Brassica rapa]